MRTPEAEFLWMQFWGLRIGMNEQEINDCPLGRMQDFISCFAITNGALDEKDRELSYDEFMSLR